MDKAKAEVNGEGKVDDAINKPKAEDEVVGTKVALGGAGEVGEGVEEHGGRLDLAKGSHVFLVDKT